MDKIAHVFIGAVLGIILILLTHYYLNWFPFDLLNIAIMIILIYVYSLLSDCDMKNSAITWTFIPISIVMLIFGYFMNNDLFLIFGMSLITITFLMAQFFPHRGFTHSILFGIVVSLPWIYLSHEYAILAFVCFYSHLISDGEYFKLI